MLVSEVITLCNTNFELGADSYEIADATWLKWLKEGLSEIKNYYTLQETATADIASGTSQYTLPTDCITLYKLSTLEGTDYKKLKETYPVNTLQTYEYYIWEKSIKIYEPTSNITDGLKLEYFKEHTDLETTTEILIEDPYVLVEFALYRAELANRVMDVANYHKQEYFRKREELKRKQHNPPVEIHERW